MDWLTAGSLVLNMLLAVALFFKTPLNELAKRLGLGWLNRRARKLELIHQLHARMERFPTTFAARLAPIAMSIEPAFKDLPGRPEVDAALKPLQEEFEAHSTFIREYFLEFPSAVQILLKELREAIEAGFKIPFAWQGTVDMGEEYRKKTQALKDVQRLAMAIREMIER